MRLFADFFISFLFQITGNTPLMLAVKDNKTPLIDRLVELGSDVCARNNVSLIEKFGISTEPWLMSDDVTRVQFS